MEVAKPAIQYVNKDITTVDRGIIAHGCNGQGVMGSGVAKFLRNKYPEIFDEYSKICRRGKERGDEDGLLGTVNIVCVKPNIYVANCITQHLYGYDKGKYAVPAAILTSLQYMYQFAQLQKLPVYLPKIGAGRGGLDWDTEVEPIVASLASLNLNLDTYVCVWAE